MRGKPTEKKEDKSVHLHLILFDMYACAADREMASLFVQNPIQREKFQMNQHIFLRYSLLIFFFIIRQSIRHSILFTFELISQLYLHLCNVT